MIARIRFDLHGTPAVATLEDDLRWSCPDPLVAGLLNLELSLEDQSPSRGLWYVAHARGLARRLGGTVEFAPKRPAGPGTIY